MQAKSVALLCWLGATSLTASAQSNNEEFTPLAVELLDFLDTASAAMPAAVRFTPLAVELLDFLAAWQDEAGEFVDPRMLDPGSAPAPALNAAGGAGDE